MLGSGESEVNERAQCLRADGEGVASGEWRVASGEWRVAIELLRWFGQETTARTSLCKTNFSPVLNGRVVEKSVGRGALSPCLRLHWPPVTPTTPSPLATRHSPLPPHLPLTRRITVVRTTEWGNPRRTKQLAAFGFTGHRPPATLPSRSAIARPRLSGRLPLGTLALFPPLRPGRY
jgi:hypothetical protein